MAGVMIDSGSGAQLMTAAVARQLQLEVLPSQLRIIQSGGAEFRTVGAAVVEVGLALGTPHAARSRHRFQVVADSSSLPYSLTSAEQHLADVAAALRMLQANGLKAHPDKSIFGADVVDRSNNKHERNYSSYQGHHARWALSLQDYTFTIEHRPGNKHQNADVLSRWPLAASSDGTGAQLDPDPAAALASFPSPTADDPVPHHPHRASLPHSTAVLLPYVVVQRMTIPVNLDDPLVAAQDLLGRTATLSRETAAAMGNLRIAQHRDTLRYALTHSGSYKPAARQLHPGS
ncbi:retrovirus-related Pol polyprotein from transposon, partial [Haematococcus lacustris]